MKAVFMLAGARIAGGFLSIFMNPVGSLVSLLSFSLNMTVFILLVLMAAAR